MTVNGLALSQAFEGKSVKWFEKEER